MKEEKNYILREKDFYDFVKECSSPMDRFLHITTTEYAKKLVLICNNFFGASILGFTYVTEMENSGSIYKKKNDLKLTMGLNVFLPGKGTMTTFHCNVVFVFEDILELTYFPTGINNSNEIEIEKFIISENECIFSCVLKFDKTKKIRIKSKRLLVVDFISRDNDDYGQNFYQNTNKIKKRRVVIRKSKNDGNSYKNPWEKRTAIEKSIETMNDDGFSKIELIKQLSLDFNITEEKALELIESYENDDFWDDIFGNF